MHAYIHTHGHTHTQNMKRQNNKMTPKTPNYPQNWFGDILREEFISYTTEMSERMLEVKWFYEVLGEFKEV